MVFNHSKDYRSIYCRGEELGLTRTQAETIRILHEAKKSRNPNLSSRQIKHRLERIERYPNRISDIFKGKNKDILGTLIKRVGQDLYYLDI